MRRIALVNQKGGCGKTTTAINVASFLAINGRKVFLIDLDPQGHVALGLGKNPELIDNSIYEVLLGEIPIKKAIHTVKENLDAIFSDVVLSAFEQVMAGTPKREYRLTESLKEIDRVYDYLIIDSPPSLGLLTFNGLMASEEVIIPVDPSAYSLQGLERLLETIQIIDEKAHHKLSIRILAANIDRRTNFGRNMVETLKARFPENCFKTIINTCTALREAASRGNPITDWDDRSPAFRDYLDLAREIMNGETELRADYYTRIDFEKLNYRELLPGSSEAKGFSLENEKPSDQPGGREIVFTLEAPENALVAIAGDFNNWAPHSLQLKESQGRKIWQTAITLMPGSYEYKYVIDGHWTPDPINPKTVPESFGGVNSVIDV
jgi:chromosome partitioning protein